MNYATIKKYDIANGLGVRVSLFVSGCTHHCKNCFNAVAWDFNYGKLFTKEVEDEIITALKQPMITGLTLLGGEPMEPQNQRVLYEFLKRVKKEVPNKDIWCYTGYTLETDLLEGKVHLDITDDILSMIDVLVDGKFVEELKDITLKFRGSSNQRVIDLKTTLATNQITLLNFR
ncbi:MAG: anaerobic ribonucleoside-triphosphate reductase activating protein [Roseburia sp.]|nr:anaerobic ribonucleoside-triphosphate reductase activating protein [Anaeroplasma bactoclasticum]MCM1195625.1 anaerobic ribonucleoside-triphosphate reductase activating protein [Roseburia sp.]MCM1556630.1 anaerobic ribonucleoside-triphosphate reductase activating protein [Anaeroplasma bactoclasticum]